MVVVVVAIIVVAVMMMIVVMVVGVMAVRAGKETDPYPSLNRP